MTLQKTEDYRGYFQELAKFTENLPPIKQISKFTINPKQTRGNHFHRNTWEVFILEKGTVLVELQSVGKSEIRKELFISGDGKCLVVGPLVNHSFYSEEGCEILVLSSKIFDPNDTDTFKR